MERKVQVFDIEADGLDATKIHCLSYREGNKIVSLTTYDEMRKFFSEAEVLVGHNIASYDIPTSERILGIEIKNKKIVDTLALSWYIYYTRPQHGLESWGETYNLPKIEIDDWEGLSLEEYVERCERDVQINSLLWDDCLKFLLRLYEGEREAWRLIGYLSFKMHCAALQEASGWLLDVERCTQGVNELSELKDQKTLELAKIMPQVPKYAKRHRPAKPYLQNGELSASGVTWQDRVARANDRKDSSCIFIDSDTIKEVVSYDPPKPNSPAQIKDFLFSLGWKPDEFKYENDKNDRKKVRKIPQINTQVPGAWGLTESVKRLVERHPELEPLDGLSVIAHRLSILKGFLVAEKDGMVKAEIQGLTNTLRFKHRVCLNLPTPSAPYGELIRGCLIAPEGHELCGSDKSSLEDKVKQHYLYEVDPDYVETMRGDDYDPHLALAVIAGLMTEEEKEFYKWYKKQ